MLLRRAWRVTAAAVAVQWVVCAPVAGQEPAPSPSPGQQPELIAPVPPPPPDRNPRRVVVPGRPSERRDSAGAGRLKTWRALSLSEGEGRLLVDGAAREVKAGDALGAYVVKAVGPGRVVLEDASGLAIITFDRGGAARVRLVLTADPTRQKTIGASPQ